MNCWPVLQLWSVDWAGLQVDLMTVRFPLMSVYWLCIREADKRCCSSIDTAGVTDPSVYIYAFTYVGFFSSVNVCEGTLDCLILGIS